MRTHPVSYTHLDVYKRQPNFGVDESAANYRSNSGYISLEWDGDVLEVHQYLAHDGSDKLITKFDGTDKVQLSLIHIFVDFSCKDIRGVFFEIGFDTLLFSVFCFQVQFHREPP